MSCHFGKAVPKAVHGDSLARSGFLPLQSLVAVRSKVNYADKTDIHFPAFADAAFPRKCGTLISALRPMSPDRPLKASLRREFKQPFRRNRDRQTWNGTER